MISAVICTRNRASKLEQCLLHMAEQNPGATLAWQLVVVDNASEDETRRVVDKFTAYLPIKYVFEAKRGLSNARNRGILEAEYPIIAFTDDDCLVGSDWLAAVAAQFAKRNALSILGGRVELAHATDFPVASRTHDRPEEIATIEDMLAMMIGCNMAFRRGVFDEIGLFDPALGKGTRIGSAEDIDILYRALKRGRSIAYSPDAVVRHAHGRDTATLLQDVTHDYVRGRGAFYCKFISDRHVAKMAYWEVRGLIEEQLRFRSGWEPARLLRSLLGGALYKLIDALVNCAAGNANRLAVRERA
jgi:hypothetical protein